MHSEKQLDIRNSKTEKLLKPIILQEEKVVTRMGTENFFYHYCQQKYIADHQGHKDEQEPEQLVFEQPCLLNASGIIGDSVPVKRMMH